MLFGLAPSRTWRRWSAVAAIIATVLLEIATYTGALRMLYIGSVPYSWSSGPALLVAVLLGATLLGRRHDYDTFITFWACAVVVLSVAVIGFSRLSRPVDLVGLVVASVDEEMVYRLALPVLIAATLVGFGLPRKWARLLGYTVAGIAWVLLPGHRAQMHSFAEVMTFVELALLTAVICLRSGSVLATATVHVCSNLLTVLVWREVLPQDDRSIMFGGLLMLMLLAYGLRWRYPRSAEDGDGKPVIDVEAMVVDLREPAARRRAQRT